MTHSSVCSWSRNANSLKALLTAFAVLTNKIPTFNFIDTADTNAFKHRIFPLAFYPSFAMTCMDLFRAGIKRSGSYIVNGTLQWCSFIGINVSSFNILQFSNFMKQL